MGDGKFYKFGKLVIQRVIIIWKLSFGNRQAHWKSCSLTKITFGSRMVLCVLVTSYMTSPEFFGYHFKYPQVLYGPRNKKEHKILPD